MSSHFPPSSPFLDHTTNDEDPFNGNLLQYRNFPNKLVINSPFETKKGSTDVATKNNFEYPTPNPSSTTGARSSSPARQRVANGGSPSAVQSTITNSSPTATKKIDYKDPLGNALRVRLYSQQSVKLGRSTRCDHFIKSKYASRCHLKIKYNSDVNEIAVLCKGYNGVVVELGERYYGYIKQTGENIYKFVKKDPKNVKDEEEIFSEIPVFKDEQLILPYNEKIHLDIKGYKILLDVINDLSETEDELPVLHKDSTSSELSFLPEDEESEQQEEKAEEEEEEDIEPIERVKTIELPRLTKSSSSQEGFDVKSVKVEQQRAKSLEPEQIKKDIKRVPLGTKSESVLNQETNSTQRRRKADPGLSPQKKKIDQSLIKGKKYLDPREKIQNLKINEILQEISANHDLDSIKNVLINHLAFSRLSQTPLKQLQTVSQSIQGLSRYQLRAVLASIESIGVIYRHGKDAAGKPLDEEYYYDVEKDDDFERTKLVSSIKGSSGLRNCRKTHKQYFWKKPVTKK